MANCNRNRVRAKTISQNKVDKYKTVDFNIASDIDACAKINTRRYIETEAGTVVYKATDVPADLINACETVGCKNTGTLFMTTVEATKKAAAKFSSVGDALDYAAGIVYMYVKVPAAGNYTVEATLSDLPDTKQKDADVYRQTIKATREGFYPVTVELAKAPDETVGKGWTPTTSGTVIKVSVGTEAEGTAMIGLSSIAFFNDVEDLINNEVVKISCLTGVDGDDTLDATEEACQGAEYDKDTAAVERTVTGKNFTPNYMSLHPMYVKADTTVGFVMRTVQLTVQAEGEYGVVHLADHMVDECGLIYASMEEGCNISDALLSRLSGPNLVTLDERQYQAINTKLNPDAEFVGTKLFFNKELVGRDVIVSYPQETDAKVYYLADDEVNERKVQMTYRKDYSDGTAETFLYRNVFITSFPMGLTSDGEGEKSFTISIRRDKNGRFVEVYNHNAADATL